MGTKCLAIFAENSCTKKKEFADIKNKNTVLTSLIRISDDLKLVMILFTIFVAYSVDISRYDYNTHY